MTSEPATRTIHLSIKGMGCAACVTAVRSALERVPGVERALVELADASAAVEALPATSPELLVKAVEDAGYEAQTKSG